ncbi:VRR-NUC domain-containing protein [Romboutsia sp.]|uniref:VRR-NUC domain-containing protein n=1 Tax=Romboutsia sp. TaxID=1965302 RepID=UPI003F2FFB2C
MKENELQALIVSALRFKGYCVWMNYQNVRQGWDNPIVYTIQMKKHGWMKGIPDLTVIGRETNGNTIMLYIECKSEKGVLSADQKHILNIIKVLGIETRVVRSLDQIQDLLDKDIIRVETLLLEQDIEYARIAKEKEEAKQLEKLKRKEAKQLEKLKRKEAKQLEKLNKD